MCKGPDGSGSVEVVGGNGKVGKSVSNGVVDAEAGREGTLALYAPDVDRGGSMYWFWGWHRLTSTLGRGPRREGASGTGDNIVPPSAVSLGSMMGALM